MYRKHRRAPRKRTEILVNVTSRRCRNSNRASFFPCSSASIFASSATHSPYRFAWHRRAPRLRGQPTDNESAANQTKHSTPFTYPFYATCIFQLSYYTRLATYQHCSPLVNRFYLRRANRGAPQQFAPNNRSTPFLRIRLLRIFLRSNLISFPLPVLIYFHQSACVRSLDQIENFIHRNDYSRSFPERIERCESLFEDPREFEESTFQTNINEEKETKADSPAEGTLEASYKVLSDRKCPFASSLRASIEISAYLSHGNPR